jgi:hypothetical protein
LKKVLIICSNKQASFYNFLSQEILETNLFFFFGHIHGTSFSFLWKLSKKIINKKFKQIIRNNVYNIVNLQEGHNLPPELRPPTFAPAPRVVKGDNTHKVIIQKHSTLWKH